MSGNSNYYSNSNSRGSSRHESYHDRSSGASDSRCRGGYRGRRGFDHYNNGAQGPRRGRGRTERYHSDRSDPRDYRDCHATYTSSHRDVDYRNNDREESPRASPRDPIYKNQHLGEKNKSYYGKSKNLDFDQFGNNSKNDHGTVRGDFGEYTRGGSELRDRPERVEKFPTGISDSFALVDEIGHQGERIYNRQHYSSVRGTHGTNDLFETHGLHGIHHAPNTNGTYGDKVTSGIYGTHETCGAHASTGSPGISVIHGAHGSPGSSGLHVTQGRSGNHGPLGTPVTQSNHSTHIAHVTHITHSTQGTQGTHTTHAAHVSSFTHKRSSDTGQEYHRTSTPRDFTPTGPLTDHLVKSYAKNTSTLAYKNPWISLLKLGEGKTANRLEQNYKDLTKVNDQLADLQSAILKHTCSLGLLNVYSKRDAINVEICSENLDEFTYL